MLSQTDELTGLLNVRAFGALPVKEITMVERYPRPFKLMMIDVDELKEVKDHFGLPLAPTCSRRLPVRSATASEPPMCWPAMAAMKSSS